MGSPDISFLENYRKISARFWPHLAGPRVVVIPSLPTPELEPEPRPKLPPRPEVITVPWRSLLWDVAEEHNIPPDDIMSGRRDPPVVAARRGLYIRMAKAGMTARQIGKAVGRDRTTILSAVAGNRWSRQWPFPVPVDAAAVRWEGEP